MTLGQMVLGALGEDVESRIPEKIRDELKAADDDVGIVGLLHDVYCAVPNGASVAFMIAAQLVKRIGDPVGLFVGEFIESIPPTSRALRESKGKTEKDARGDLVKFYKTWKAGGKKMSEEQKNAVNEGNKLIAADEKKPAEEKVEEKPVEEWETALSNGFTDPIERQTAQAIAWICYADSNAGSNHVFTTDVAARDCLKAWYDATRKIPEQLSGAFKRVALNNGTLLRTLGVAEAADPKSKDFDKNLTAARRALFQNNIEAINMALTNFRAKHEGSSAGAGARDIMQNLSLLAGHLPGGHGESIRSIKGFAVNTALYLIGLRSMVVLYVVALCVAASWDSKESPWLTWFSFGSALLLLVVPAIVGLMGAITAGREVGPEESFFAKLFWPFISVVVGELVGPLLVGAAFLVDAIYPEDVRWFSVFAAPVFVVYWALVSIGLPQKLINSFGSIFSQKHLESMQWLARVADTIAYSVLLFWVPVLVLSWLRYSYPESFPQKYEWMILALAGLFALLSPFLARMITHSLPVGAVSPTAALVKTNQVGDSTLLSQVQRTWIPRLLVGTIVLVLVLAFGYVEALKPSADWALAVGKHEVAKGKDWVDEAVGMPTAPSAVQTSGGNTGSGASAVTNNPAPVKASGGSHKSKREKMCVAYGGKPKCEAYVKKFDEPAPFPCPCE